MVYLLLNFHYLLPPLPPEEVRELPPDDVRDDPPELDVPPELLVGGLDTAGRRLPPDGAGLLTEGVLLVGAGALRTAGVPVLPERLSGRLYVALLVGLEYVDPPELSLEGAVLLILLLPGFAPGL